jgi:hypothetical protein
MTVSPSDDAVPRIEAEVVSVIPDAVVLVGTPVGTTEEAARGVCAHLLQACEEAGVRVAACHPLPPGFTAGTLTDLVQQVIAEVPDEGLTALHAITGAEVSRRARRDRRVIIR